MGEMQAYASFTNREWSLPLCSIKVLNFTAGSTIIKEGDTPTLIYQVAKGSYSILDTL